MNEEERRRLEERRKRQKMRAIQRRKQVLRQKIIIGGMVFLAAVIVIFSSVIKANHKKQEAEAAAKAAQEKKAEEEAKRLKEENTLHMVAVGDNLYHDSILEEGKGAEESEDWNFDFLYANVKKEIENADLAAVNQESPFVNNHDEAAGYPEFATPLEGGEALVKAGFDIVTQATNHALDKRKANINKEGIEITTKAIKDGLSSGSENKNTKYCIECGKKIPTDAKFCLYCGKEQ